MDSFDKASQHEDNILDQMNKSECARNIFMMILFLNNIFNNTTVALKANFMSCYVLYFFKYAFFFNQFKIQNLHSRDPKIISFHTLRSKILSSSLYDMLKLCKTTSPQKLFPIWLNHTVGCSWSNILAKMCLILL